MVISARALPCDASAAYRLQIDRYDHFVATDGTTEHVLLRSHGVSLRLDIVIGSALAGPVTLEPWILVHRLDWQIAAVRSLAAILRSEPPPIVMDSRLPRLILALRALDARREGASLREIARGIFGETDWPGDGDYVKSRARRVVRLSEELLVIGPCGVLARQI
jgi:hypothetical protein